MLHFSFVCSFAVMSPVICHGRYQICLQRAVRDMLQLVSGVMATLGRAPDYSLQPSPLIPACCCLRVIHDSSFLCSALQVGSLCEQGLLEPWASCCWDALGRRWLAGWKGHPYFLPPATWRSRGTSVNCFVWSCSKIKYLSGSSI